MRFARIEHFILLNLTTLTFAASGFVLSASLPLRLLRDGPTGGVFR